MSITVKPQVRYQEILGFGAAITDAAAYCLSTLLDREVADELLRQAFVEANFSFARVPMNSADFSRMNYVMAHKLDLSDFCLRDDREPATPRLSKRVESVRAPDLPVNQDPQPRVLYLFLYA